jgi:hypothetical protein
MRADAEPILEEQRDREILTALGLLQRGGSMAPDTRRKFQQIRHALELLLPLVESNHQRPLVLADANCGRSYLGLLLSYVLRLRGHSSRLLGFDRDAVAIGRCRELAKRVRDTEAEFLTCDAAQMALPAGVDLLMSLHGCDRATDAAMGAGVQAQARVLAVVPCCHRELRPLLGKGHELMSAGILREDYAAVLTDALRAEWLRVQGYKVDVVEFVPLEHTARNRLIRATWTGHADESAKERIQQALSGLISPPAFLATCAD